MISTRKITTIDDFELGKPIGTGRFGQVWLAKHKSTGYIVALKMMKMADLKTEMDVKNLRRETEIHLALNNPNILRMYGYFYDSQNIYFIMEYAGKGDIWRILRDNGHFNEAKTASYILQVCKALMYMHSMNVIHRDLKPENIIMGCDDLLKLGDFGWSVYNGDNKRYTFCGTAEYLPPEICTESVYSLAVDIWCLGILCYEFCTGTTPVQGKGNIRATKQKILAMELEFPAYLSDECVDFISQCCKKEPSERIALADAIKHPFLKQAKTS